MKTKKTPAPRRAGTSKTATEALALIGDDPETLLLAIRLLERMRLARQKNPRVPISY